MVQLEAQGRKWSGMIITDDGFILTTADQIQSVPLINVTLPTGATKQGWVMGRDDFQGIAVIQVDATGLTQVTIGN